MNFLSANDFELALQDYSSLSTNLSQKLKSNFKDLRWFVFDRPNLYTSSFNNFIGYLVFVIITKLYTETYTLTQYETYFTNQVVSYLQDKREYKKMTDLTYIKNVWTQALEIISIVVNISDKENLVSNSPVYFTSCTHQFKINLPIVNIDNDSVCPLIVLPFFNKKPSWYTTPSLFKIYKYFTNQNILIKRVNILWIDLEDITNFELELIPTTENVANFVSNYFDIGLYPYPNIFNKNRTDFYSQSPVSSFL